MFELETVPHSWIGPYRSIALYNNNLFSINSYDLLSNRQYVFPSCNPSCSCLIYIYVFSSLACDPDVVLNIWHRLLVEFSDHSVLLVDMSFFG